MRGKIERIDDSQDSRTQQKYRHTCSAHILLCLIQHSSMHSNIALIHRHTQLNHLFGLCLNVQLGPFESDHLHSFTGIDVLLLSKRIKKREK